MKICIFSDIHGNHTAFKKMLENEKCKVDLFIFLGDIWGYFYEQEEIISEFRNMTDLYAVRGNHEQYYLKCQKDKMYKDILIHRYGSSYGIEISKDERQYLSMLPDHIETRIDGKLFGIFHGGIEDHLEQRIYPDSVLDVNIYGNKYDFFVVGHTHYRFTKKVGDTLIVNPGSLGQPRDGKGFGYCILDTNDHQISFKNVDIDLNGLLKDIDKKERRSENYKYLLNKYGR